MDGGTGNVTFYVEVPDLEAALSKVESLGDSRVMEPTDVPEGPSIAMFTDPRAISWDSSRPTLSRSLRRRTSAA
jgi:predicted enzyme related to lactoylglutathione lyase